ncbi:hypothetical protein RRG08_036126 [Elysia crispata]|uniref:Integrase catalytic domain-containing protein n=1 Tax=Elysia crispata TaxID=231223 RepID=A0AAE0ZJA0_9GAST|nr:hypothetical protein RRG08_036126 [Elysia crispata]
MPFSLKSAAQTFQRLMDSVLQDIDSAFVYLDDILKASSTEKEHLDDLKAVFRRFIDHGLVIRLEKCLFIVSSLEFLGHQVSKKGSSPTQAKIARFGVPGDISSERGSQFTSLLWSEIAARLVVKLHHTSAYHPQANGMIEHFNRTLKTALKALLTGPNWVEELPWVLLRLRTTPKEDLGYSSAELVYSEPLTIPGELVPPKSAKPMDDLLLNFRLNIPLYAPHTASHHTSARTYLSPSLLAAKHVYVRRDGTKGPLQRPYSGPYTVLTPGDKTFLIDIGGRAE